MTSQRHPDSLSSHFDVLIIGGGAAGLYAALALPTRLQVGLVTKDTLSLSASDWAQGGIAAAIAPGDAPQFHVADTLKAGAGLCDRSAVEFLVEHAPEQVDALLKMGIVFDRVDHQLAFTLEAAHSHPRVLHAADTTGRALVTTLTNQVLQRPNIQVIPQTYTLDLWLNQRRCQGVCLLHQNQICWVQARAVVLATGGGGQVFAQTTNPALSTGDGVAMAWRVGAQLRDLEFVQFHPTALTLPGAPRFLISEAVRGEGAHLIDVQGRRFTFDYHPAGELAPRDVVSRAIFTHLQTTGASNNHVWLDLRPIPSEQIQRRFPKIVQVCQRWGIDVFQQPIPVAPAAHYWMGGITTHLDGQTTIPGLYAVGEVASTGVHGANRLASNSLLECLVFSAQLAHLQLPLRPTEMPAGPQTNAPRKISQLSAEHWAEELASIQKLRQQLPELVWQSAGICREAASLQAAIAQVNTWKTEFRTLRLSQSLFQLFAQPTTPIILPPEIAPPIRTWAETCNLLDIADLILKSAEFRTESRGGHYRQDYPQTDPAWEVHTSVHDQTWEKAALH